MESGVKELELFLLVFALYSCFLMDFLNNQFRAFGWSWNIDLICYVTALLCAFVVRHTLADHCELQRISQMNQLRQRQYELLCQRQSSEQEIRRMCHDLKHQLLALRQDPAQADEMLQRVQSTLEQYQKVVYADNSILNTLLQEKAEAARCAGIDIQMQMRIPPCEVLDDMDLCMIFGNALDNALEAVRRIEEPGHRFVSISSVSEPGFWMVRFQNPYQGELTLRGGLPCSSKKDKANHGIGLRSVRTCVEQHGGTMLLSTEDNCFSLSIMIPQKTPPCCSTSLWSCW
jgi:sensor histidine kinase regulating citrate/malate metabolism